MARSVGGGGSGTSLLARVRWLVPAIGVPALVVAAALAPSDAGTSARQDWPPFVLVGGLLLLGLVAQADGLFDAAGALVAGLARGGISLLVAAAALVAVVTAVLNLDTAVAFLTPVLVVAARRAGPTRRRCSTSPCSWPTAPRCSSRGPTSPT